MRRRNFSFRPVASLAADDTLDERLEIRGISLVARLQLGRRNPALIDRVLELVDGRPHLTQCPAQLDLALTLRVTCANGMIVEARIIRIDVTITSSRNVKPR